MPIHMYDVIRHKKEGRALSGEEIGFFVDGFCRGDIPDYQAAALLMAICLRGMDARETAQLTDAMARSGDTVDLSPIPGVKVDKHSTGGVGDKTTLVVAPMVAACGVPVAKMSGRGLGHTGGTIDKLEAIPGFETSIDKERFFTIVRKEGLSVIGQSANIAPADKKLYALRDVTATVDSLPLIASSIMSKKLASGADAILLDVKTGSGAFMKTLEDSIALARAMVDIGEATGRRTVALITDMDVPLGNAIGNALEVAEAVAVLKGGGPGDLRAVCVELAAQMLVLGGAGPLAACREKAAGTLQNGAAFARLRAMVAAQGGDVSVLDNPARFGAAPVVCPLAARAGGYVTSVDSEACGRASVVLGAGRAAKDDPIDYSAGIVLCKKPGDAVEEGETLALLHTSSEALAREAAASLSAAIAIGPAPPPTRPVILARVPEEQP